MKHASNFSSLIYEARLKANKSQCEVGHRLGGSTGQYISNIERGICSLAPKYFKPVSKFLKVPLSDLRQAAIDDFIDKLDRGIAGK